MRKNKWEKLKMKKIEFYMEEIKKNRKIKKKKKIQCDVKKNYDK